MKGLLRLAGFGALATMFLLFGLRGVPVDNPVPTVVAYCVVGLVGAGLLKIADLIEDSE